ncbi:MAG: rhodanese-like domain-containing protein [Syntrophobacterales bacterium]
MNFLAKCFVGISFSVILLFLSTMPTFGKETPLWWEQAELEAKREGYVLITLDDLEGLYEADKTFLILDVRPDYEYKRGHLPKAANLEFHLGERLTLDPEKRKEFEKILGPDKDRTIVIYCRSFR